MQDYSHPHERANIITHAFGFFIGLIAIPFLLWRVADSKASIGAFLGMIIYGISFLMVFGFSSLYHCSKDPKRRTVMKLWDHISIYYLIAGTYTPYILAYAQPEDGKMMLLVLWILAFLGTIFKYFFTGRFRLLSSLIYLAMGWLIVFSPQSFQDAFPEFQWNTVMLGGAFYSLGVIFYMVKQIPFHHAIWHVFVLGGAVSHFVGIWGVHNVL